ncbi:hypothetical protein N7509_003088 [Penicillium cosmopolitanum]|uniref:Uncharacterized protein n=1 Tax=Penicillium cosmopolitanum TaxID=1131564 RepID=A0A9W9W4G6_9EURO|nr:uncharacterized protein N7509_003088 [Penicillium cosmopolitanum]KAJ5403217.1 hypothetical protein N7509_003088 [Penicillium cosmopolitanum]
MVDEFNKRTRVTTSGGRAGDGGDVPRKVAREKYGRSRAQFGIKYYCVGTGNNLWASEPSSGLKLPINEATKS